MDRNRMQQLIILLFMPIILYLTACTVTQTDTPVPITVTVTELPPTVTSIASMTVEPTGTKTPTKYPTHDITCPCFSLKQFSIPDYCSGGDSYFSPDTNMAALYCWRKDQELVIANRNEIMWEITPNDFSKPEDHIYETYLEPKGWSGDGKTVYFSSYIARDGGGYCSSSYGYQGVFTMDVKTGKTETILPILSLVEGEWENVSISPTGEYLAYSQNNQMVIQSLTSDKKRVIKLDSHITTGKYMWYPDDQTLVYEKCTTINDYMATKNSQLVMYSLKTGKSKVVFEQKGQELRIIGGDPENGLIIEQIDRLGTNTVRFVFHLDTQQVMTLTPEN